MVWTTQHFRAITASCHLLKIKSRAAHRHWHLLATQWWLHGSATTLQQGAGICHQIFCHLLNSIFYRACICLEIVKAWPLSNSQTVLPDAKKSGFPVVRTNDFHFFLILVFMQTCSQQAFSFCLHHGQHVAKIQSKSISTLIYQLQNNVTQLSFLQDYYMMVIEHIQQQR